MIIKSVREIVCRRELPKVAPRSSVREACHVLDRFNVGAAAVLDGDRLVGMFSERDVIRRCICGSRRTSDTLVEEIMTPEPSWVGVDGTLADALGFMIAGHFNHLPVLDDGRVVGLLSIRDIPAEYHVMRERYDDYVHHRGDAT